RDVIAGYRAGDIEGGRAEPERGRAREAGDGEAAPVVVPQGEPECGRYGRGETQLLERGGSIPYPVGNGRADDDCDEGTEHVPRGEIRERAHPQAPAGRDSRAMAAHREWIVVRPRDRGCSELG